MIAAFANKLRQLTERSPRGGGNSSQPTPAPNFDLLFRRMAEMEAQRDAERIARIRNHNSDDMLSSHMFGDY